MGEPEPVLLASSSPRRRELLERIGLTPRVVAPAVDESAGAHEDVGDHVRRLARTKATAVRSDGALTVAGDTVIVDDGRIMGKPADDDEAAAMLRRLAGRTHRVVTGVALRRGEALVVDVAVARVTLRRLSDREVAWYVATGEPRGKAGAYAIQGAGEALIERLDGSWSGVVGLPLPHVIRMARLLGVDLLSRRR